MPRNQQAQPAKPPLTFHSEPILRRSQLFHRAETPPHLHKVNVNSFYRSSSAPVLECVASTLSLHNESFSIWTHAVALSLGLLALRVLYVADLTASDFVALCTFISAAILCFLLSTLFHVFQNLSEQAHTILLAADFLGIHLLIGGHFVAVVHMYIDPARPLLRAAYLWFNACVCMGGVAVALLALVRQIRATRGTSFAADSPSRLSRLFHLLCAQQTRLAVWAVFAFVGSTPAFLSGLLWKPANLVFLADLMSIALYVSGFFCYVALFPESHHPPGSFDVSILHSHSLMHILMSTAVFWSFFLYLFAVSPTMPAIWHIFPAL
mmetsp:Transcript_19530/g.49644  ORF Transcript_19530/g.49644 Transcript_19530/m.49644 type:complete len:323 (-) Transcript_19530:124-1092(-)